MNDAERDGLAGLAGETRRAVVKRLTTIAGLPEVSRIIIFGSYAKGTFTPESDLDVAVFFRTEDVNMLEYYRVLQHICACPEIDIQVQAFNSSELDDPCGIMEEIISYGVDYPL